MADERANCWVVSGTRISIILGEYAGSAPIEFMLVFIGPSGSHGSNPQSVLDLEGLDLQHHILRKYTKIIIIPNSKMHRTIDAAPQPYDSQWNCIKEVFTSVLAVESVFDSVPPIFSGFTKCLKTQYVGSALFYVLSSLSVKILMILDSAMNHLICTLIVLNFPR